MKQILTLTLAAILTTSVFAQTDSTKKILEEGTVVTLELMQDLNSGTNDVGDIIEFQVAEPIIIGDRVLVAKGTKATGKVTEAKGRKGMGKAGTISFSVDYLNMPNGKNIKLEGEQKAEGKDKKGAAIAQAVVLSPLFLMKKGKNKKYKKGEIFKVFIEEDTEL